MTEPDLSGVSWRRSSRSLDANTCVEMAHIEQGVAVRDSEAPRGPVLAFGRADWLAFVTAVRRGLFDVP
jgi:hypothetical protein